jgi:hypothetical protein
MAKKTKDPRLENFPKKYRSVLEKLCSNDDGTGQADDFLDVAQQATKEELNSMIVKYNENRADFEKDRDADTDLEEAKVKYQEAGQVYRDGIKVNEAKAMYCVFIKKSL